MNIIKVYFKNKKAVYFSKKKIIAKKKREIPVIIALNLNYTDLNLYNAGEFSMCPSIMRIFIK